MLINMGHMQKKALDVEPFKNYLGSLSEKNGIMWGKFPNWGGGGLTQTHFLMFIFTPKNCDFLVKTKNVPEVPK